MNFLRRIHLYLGCVFAPLLIFFAISGVWQLLRLNSDPKVHPYLSSLSTIHTGGRTRGFPHLSTPILNYIILAMAVSLVLTVILGIIMTFKFAHRRTASICLGMGFLVPTLIIVSHYYFND